MVFGIYEPLDEFFRELHEPILLPAPLAAILI